MKKIVAVAGCLLLVIASPAQNIAQKIQKAYKQFESDSQLEHATISLYIINAKTGAVIFKENAQTGLAPASTQKIITASTAFELLGKDFRYKTEWFFKNEKFENGVKHSLLVLKGNGDPTLGSWRYQSTKDSAIFPKWMNSIKAKQSNRIITGIWIDDRQNGDISSVPGGYIWDDIGNYYGSGWSLVNWRENQYDLFFSSRAESLPTHLIKTDPAQEQVKFTNLVTAGKAGSGDNAYIYCPPFSKEAVVKGTIPPDQKSFVISGAMPDPAYTLGISFRNYLLKNKMAIDSPVSTMRSKFIADAIASNLEKIDGAVYYSPALDSIVYWFLKRSVNLYGEALLNTFTISGDNVIAPKAKTEIVKDFWKQKGIDPKELNIYDGSGLSPLNRITTHAQVEILKYAKQRPWFPFFVNAFPEFNNMKMKSGTINGVKAFCGYHTSSRGDEYIFSFLVNNYNGSASSVVNKMYKVLDVLK